jgi:hypothetical protein
MSKRSDKELDQIIEPHRRQIARRLMRKYGPKGCSRADFLAEVRDLFLERAARMTRQISYIADECGKTAEHVQQFNQAIRAVKLDAILAERKKTSGKRS